MKKIILILSVATILTSCQIIDTIEYIEYMTTFSEEEDSRLAELASGHALFYGEFPELNSFIEIAEYIESIIEYRDDDGDTWNNPEKTFLDGYGDCEDFAILFMDIAYIQLGLKFDLAGVEAFPFSQRTVVDGGRANHAVVFLDGELYSAYEGTLITDYNAKYLYSFDHVFSQNFK